MISKQGYRSGDTSYLFDGHGLEFVEDIIEQISIALEQGFEILKENKRAFEIKVEKMKNKKLDFQKFNLIYFNFLKFNLLYNFNSILIIYRDFVILILS